MNGSETLSNPDEVAARAAPHGVRLVILLVDDDVPLLDSTADAIAAFGHLVYRAVDAKQAWALLEANPFDVLMADINLPDLSGEVLAAEARALRPTMKIVFVTGRTDIRDPKSSGLDPYMLRKPYDLAAIEALLDALTGGAKG